MVLRLLKGMSLYQKPAVTPAGTGEEQAYQQSLKDNPSMKDTAANRLAFHNKWSPPNQIPLIIPETGQIAGTFNPRAGTATEKTPGATTAAGASIANKEAAETEKAKEGLQKSIASYHEGQAYASQNTGPGDYGLTMRFVEATKPSSGFRFTNTELQLIESRRGLIDAAQAKLGGIATGVMYDNTQRGQMLDVMKLRAAIDGARLEWMREGHKLGDFGGGKMPVELVPFYLQAADGSKGKARTMAKNDGWGL